jgi:hypothetical protein
MSAPMIVPQIENTCIENICFGAYNDDQPHQVLDGPTPVNVFSGNSMRFG